MRTTMHGILAATLGLGALAGAAAVRAEAPVDPHLEFAFEEVVTLAADIPVGETALGRRNIVPITGGRFEGPGLRGTIIPGGWDWQLGRKDGCLQIEADYMLRTDDGAVINVINKGVACRDATGRPVPLRTIPVFEAPAGKYAWLGQSAFVGTLEPVRENGGPAVRIRFYKVN